MTQQDEIHKAFLESALSKYSFTNLSEFHQNLNRLKTVTKYEIAKKPVTQLDGWNIDKETGNLSHHSGKFFTITGLEINTNLGSRTNWKQPIIIQQEIGFLGFITKKINGVLHFLVQIKMEPGNINFLQISPTLQATRSNFTRVHGGTNPLHIDYFRNASKYRVLLDQLQSEKNGFFLKKRNRNIIIQIDDNEKIPEHEEFFWLTLAQLNELLKSDNLVHMETKSVLSGIIFHNNESDLKMISSEIDTDLKKDIMNSLFAIETGITNSIDSIINRFVDMKIKTVLNIRLLPLNAVEDWTNDGNRIAHKENKFFSVIGVSVKSSSREVKSWDQPLIDSADGGIVCFFCKKINGIMNLLFQIRVEPGNFDTVEFAPTLQFNPSDFDNGQYPEFYGEFLDIKKDRIIFDTRQSDEGGRFYHDEYRYILAEIVDDQITEIPENFIWMTLGQAKEIMRHSNYFNIEARTLLSCINLSL
jgi:dTDP-4-dehydro-6-deoxy-alpha-D-glucopyranose 2,3-dehydratase